MKLKAILAVTVLLTSVLAQANREDEMGCAVGLFTAAGAPSSLVMGSISPAIGATSAVIATTGSTFAAAHCNVLIQLREDANRTLMGAEASELLRMTFEDAKTRDAALTQDQFLRNILAIQ